MSVLYSQFFLKFVLRKKSDLINPNYHYLADMVLPRESVIHYLPQTPEELGPSTEEPLIGSYPDGVNIFFNRRFEAAIGKVRPTAFNVAQAITAYRKSHYKYQWARNLPSYLSRKKELLVNNLSLGQHLYRYTFTRFTQFEKAYNQLYTAIDSVKAMTEETQREQYLRIELPPSLPDYRQMLNSVQHYRKAFDNEGKYTGTSNQAVAPFKGYGCYWIMDWYLFLIGEDKLSLFGRLNENELEKLHIIFSFNGLSLIINLGLVKKWLTELNDKEGKVTPLRINAAKRFLLTMRNLIAGGALPGGVTEENETTEDQKAEGKSGKVSNVVSEPEQASGKSEEGNDDQEKTLLDDSESEEINDQSVTMLDLFLDNKKTVSRPDEPETSEGGGGTDEDYPEEWTSPVDDELLYNPDTEALGVSEKNIFVSPESGVDRALEQRAKAGNLTLAEQKFFQQKAQSYKHIKMDNGESLGSFVKIDEKVLRKLQDNVAPPMLGIIDNSQLDSRATHLKKDYPGLFLDRDVAGMVLNIQNSGIALTDFKKETIVNAESAFDVYTMSVHPVDGSPTTRTFRLPKVDEDATFTIDGVKQHLQIQRMEIPIRKISNTKVALTSYYDRKLMVSRSQKVVDDYGWWLVKQITLLGENGKIDVSRNNVFDPTWKTPSTFSALAKRFRLIKTKDFTFNFDLVRLMGSEEKAAKAAKPDSVPVGKDGEFFLYMDGMGNIYRGKELLGTFESLLGISTAKAPVEVVNMNVNGYPFPIGVVLCYYFGIDELLKVIQADYRVVPAGEKVLLTEDEYVVSFNDEHLIFNRRDRLTSLIMGGLRKVNNLASFSRYDLNNKGVWVPAMADKRVKPGHFEEMRLVFDMFIDPITKAELVKRGYPTEMHYLLIEAVKMLKTDDTRHEIEITEQRFVGYERFAGRAYSEFVKAIRQYRNKGTDRRHTFDLNPEAVMMGILTDTSVNLVEEVNPIHEIKEQEVVTFGGTGGRSETTMVRRTRGQQENYAGIISEAGKDSGKVGFVSYLTSNPKISDYRGNVDLSIPDTSSGIGSVTAGLCYGTSSDDPKRALFSGVQQSQGVSAINYQTNWLRTGDELVIAHRTSELYSKPAKKAGKVTKLDKYGLVVEYDDGSIDSYPLGLKIGEASGEFHRHTRVTDLKVGDVFKKGEILGWDKMFFERDLLNPRQVSWKCGVMARIAFVENQYTFEDSIEISAEFAEKTKTPYLKKREFNVSFEQSIGLRVSVGDHVEYDSILCSIEEPHTSGLQEDSGFLGLDELGIKQIKSIHHGEVVYFEVKYNGEIEDMSESLQTFIKRCDRERMMIEKVTGNGIKNGNVGGNTSIKETSVEPGNVNIKVFVDDLNASETADKFVIGNQMKGTAGNVMQRIIKTLDGRIVDLRFSFKSMFNRMVLSLRDKMGLNEVNAAVTKKAINIFRGK